MRWQWDSTIHCVSEAFYGRVLVKNFLIQFESIVSDVINTSHSCVLTGISTTREEEGPSAEGTAPLITRQTTIVQNMTRRKANVLTETSKSPQGCAKWHRKAAVTGPKCDWQWSGADKSTKMCVNDALKDQNKESFVILCKNRKRANTRTKMAVAPGCVLQFWFCCGWWKVEKEASALSWCGFLWRVAVVKVN